MSGMGGERRMEIVVRRLRSVSVGTSPPARAGRGRAGRGRGGRSPGSRQSGHRRGPEGRGGEGWAWTVGQEGRVKEQEASRIKARKSGSYLKLLKEAWDDLGQYCVQY